MKLDELIDDAKMKAPSEAVFDLVKEFEQFASNIVQLSCKQGDEAEFKAYMDQMKESHERLRSQFERAAASYGMTFEQFCEYLETPSNFAPADWKEMQTVKEQIKQTLDVPQTAQKNSKLNKNLKI
ncbi:MAG: hypothetical protein COT85_08045 [Chlamydiae bacterium CG10_big_fil_rev_8_21_14_0_10_42_34]|nr:MAG: hypothetical protein COT85_08045 [Chlamydiae bacterium CG10_big_fil_rev_8_21_14_0_10_42_34]